MKKKIQQIKIKITFKVNGHDVLGWRIQDIAEQIHNKTDDDNNKVNLLLWRSKNSQVCIKCNIFSVSLLLLLLLLLVNICGLCE
jgi:hypothetical protein